ncbi:MAG: DUF4200 domain-containing protein [Chloroflexi bacterium]|nr:DUF4200 domain-containing protein [Chloroflexota bacterium]
MELNIGKTTDKDELAQMRSMIEQLVERVSSQEEELKQLRQQLQNNDEVTRHSDNTKEQATSRRRMLKKLGAAAAGLAIAGAAITTETHTAKAAADLNGANAALTATGVLSPSANTTLPTIEIDGTTTSSTLLTTSNPTPNTSSAALFATADGTKFGIIAISGSKDVANADFTPSLGSAAIQGRSGVGITTTDGTIGVHGISDAQAGVVGQFQDVALVTQNLLINDTVPINGLISSGVIGASDKGLGVLAASNAFSALYATASGTTGYSIYASRGVHSGTSPFNLTSENLAPLYLEPSSESYAADPTALPTPRPAGPNATGGHRAGEIHVDKDGKVWVCAQTSGIATFPPPPPAGTRLPGHVGRTPAGAPPGPGAGVFYQLTSTVFLTTPIRVVGGATEYPTGTPFVNGLYTWPPPTNTTKYTYINYYQVQGTWGPVGQTQTIPSNAIGIICTFTAAGGTTGFAILFPGNSKTIPLVSTVNYAPGVKNFATGTTVGLGIIPPEATRVYPSSAAIGMKGIAVSSYSNVQVLVDVIAYIA